MPYVTKTDASGATELTKKTTQAEVSTNSSDQNAEDIRNIKAGTTGITGYDIVVGTSADITNELATHTVSDFVAAISNGDKIYFRSGTHSIVRNEDITEDDVKLYFDPEAILDQGTAGQTLTFSGTRIQVHDGRFTGFTGSGDEIIISGTNCYFVVIQGSIDTFLIDSGATGSMILSSDNNGGIKNNTGNVTFS